MPSNRSLHVDIGGSGQGAPERTPLVLLHGFTQTARSWGRFGELLAVGRRLVTVDLPGHGDSSGVEAADLWDAAELVLDAVSASDGARLGDGVFDLCGYSLGGRIALHVALAHPERVARLVLVSATAGIEDPEARARRREADEAVAARLEQESDVDAFITRWLAQPMFAGLPTDDAQVAERRRNTAAGLASSLRTTGTGTQEPLWSRLGELGMPVLVVTGAADVRFTRSGQRLRDALPHAALSAVPGAGHAAHLERPELAARTIGHWLDSVGA